jgi:hypothetical protein
VCFFIWAFHWSLGLSRQCDIFWRFSVHFPFYWMMENMST